MKYNSIGEQLIAKAQELDPNYKPDKFNDMSEAIDVILNNSGGGYKIKKLTITKNGLYDGEFEAYKPVYVSVPPVQGDTLKALLDATQSAEELLKDYKGTSVDSMLYYTTTSNVTRMGYMFSGCSNLTTIPIIDTSKATDMSNMFTGCTSLTSVPELDTSNTRFASYMFSNCKNLTTIPQLNMSSATSLTDMFQGCSNLISIGMYGFRNTVDITPTALEHDAIVAFLNQAGNAADPGYSRITMGSAKLALLNDEEKAIATNKRWTLA